MTSQKDKIQSLITEIESTLDRAAPRLSWLLSGEATRQRELLQKTRDYLQSLKQVLDAPGGWGPLDPSTGQLATSASGTADTEPESSAAQVLQALLMEMRYLKENSLQPMRLELETLTRQRELLQAEIETLEAQRFAAANQPDQQQIHAFLETLIERLQVHLSNQVAGAIAKLEAGRAHEELLQLEGSALDPADQPKLHPSERLTQLRLLQSQSDQLLLKLDATLETVFESLQKSVESYKASLAEGLDQMHGLGRQGEVIFHTLVNQLAQQLGQDASLYLNADATANFRRQLDAAPDSGAIAAPPVDEGSTLTAQDELDLALDSLDLDLDLPADEEDLTVIQLDEPLLDEALALSVLDDDALLADDDATIIQTEPFLPEADLSTATASPELADDAESALEFNGLTSDENDLDVDDLDLLSQTDFEPITETPIESDAEETLEAFYESMFGDEAVSPAPGPEANSETTLPSLTPDEAIEETLMAEAAPSEEIESTPMAGGEFPVEAAELDLLSPHELETRLESPDSAVEDLLFEESNLADFTFDQDDINETIVPDILGDAREQPLAQSDNPLDDWFGEGLAEVPELADSAEPGVDTIESLAELLPEIIEGNTDIADLDSFAALDDAIDLDTAQDTYISAPAGEDLLSSEVPATEQHFALELDDDFISQLDSDLLNIGQTPDDRSIDGLTDLGFEGETELTDPSDTDFALDQATLDNLVADLDLSEETELDLIPEVTPDDDLNALASALLASEDLDPLDSTPESLAHEVEAVDLPLDELPDDLALEDFMPDSSELPTLETDDTLPLAETTSLAAVESWDSTVEDDEDESWEDLGLEGLAASLGDVGTPLTVDLSSPDQEQSAAEPLEAIHETIDDTTDGTTTPSVNTTEEFIDLSDELLTEEFIDLSDELPIAEDVEFTQPEVISDYELGAIENSTDDLTDSLEHLTLADLLPETPPEFDEGFSSESSAPEDFAADEGFSSEGSAPEGFAAEDLALVELPLAPELSEAPTTVNEILPDLASVDLEDDFEVGFMPDDLAEELAELSRQADQQVPEEVPTDVLLPDFEEPILYEGSMPEVPSIAEAEPKLDSALIPDLPGDAFDDFETAVDPELGLQAETEIASPLQTESPSVTLPDNSPEDDTLALLPENLHSPSISLAEASETETEALDLFEDFDTAEVISIAGDGSGTEETDDSSPLWYLGIDLGTTGISAVLLDQTSGQVYPLYWLASGSPSGSDKHFRLPVGAWLVDDEITAVGEAAWQRAHQSYRETVAPSDSVLLLKQLKPLMKIAVPHETQPGQYEPILQWSDTDTVPLQYVQTALEKLLLCMVPDQSPAPFGTVGLDQPALEQALTQLHGVVIGYPTNWPDTYSFNIREAVLASGLVPQANQIFFIEDAIATILSGLPDPEADLTDQTTALSRQPSLYNCDWEGGTIVLSAGASLTELALVNLPTTLSELSYSDFALRSFPYAGNSLDQDIVCQLLAPAESRQTLSEPSVPVASQDWHWQAELPTWAAADWDSLALDNLTLPQPGEPDLKLRYQLQHRLESSPLGQSVLEAARHLKLILQHQSQFQLDLGLQRWIIKRRDLESRIFLPYIQRINRHLNVLLTQKGFSAQSIKQVICTGGSASLPAIARWLRQKFPNATIIQDTYSGDRPNSCSRVAYGLVNLVRYPQVLDFTRQQYSDYFLLMELLRVFPQQPLPVSGIMHLLEQRGINTQACQLHILALLEGHLPPGLVPTESDRPFISQRSSDIVTYQALTEAPLFSKQSGQIYVPNEEQCRRLRAFLEQLMAQKTQNLDEPMIAQLVVESFV